MDSTSRNQRGESRWSCLVSLLCAVILWPVYGHADDALSEAMRLERTGRYEEAVEKYEQLADTNGVASAIGVARCRRAVGETDEAVRSLKVALEKHADSAELQAELSLLAFERGDYEAAQKHVDEALKQDERQLLARWISSESHRVAGRLEEAETGYLWFVRYYNREQKNINDPEQLRLIGLAAAQYARWKANSSQFNFLVNRLYPKATSLDEKYWPALLEAGLLFLEKYNKSDAKSELDEALAINPNAAEVHAARAMLALQDFEMDAAKAAIDRALEINPRLVVAHQLRADLLMVNFRLTEAIEVLEATRKLNPVDEDTLGRLAAAYGAADGLKDDPAGTRMGAVIDEAIKRNEHCGQFFHALASTLDDLRKFPHAARYYEEAHLRMPQLLGPRGRLGLMYMRLGEEVRAAELLKASFKVDPFNVRVKNMIAVLEVLQNYAVLETEHFVIKFDRGTDELLAKYAARYLEEEVYPQLVKKLGYEPQGKTLFEFFSRSGRTSGHGWFSARMVGLPYIGTVGACAGKMVALASPNDLQRTYNWGRVLRHEFVHVVNLQQTDFNIPHWFTEALAVLNEELPRPSNWNKILARRALEDKLFDLQTINLGFARPASGEDWTLAYCQAELYAQFMVQTFGEESLSKMLAAYADNLSTSAAIERCFGVKQDEFEGAYKKYVLDIVAALKIPPAKTQLSFAELQKAAGDAPDNADMQAELAYAQLQRGANADARQAALAAQKLDAKHQLAAYVLARLQLSIGDSAEALRLLETTLDEKAPQENALQLLAGLKLKAEDYKTAERLYRLGAEKFPGDDRWLRSLALVYLKADDKEQLTAVLLQLADLEYDNATIRKKLAELAIERKDYEAAAKWANQVIQIDVMDADAHATWGESLAGLKQLSRAIEEFEVAIQLDGSKPQWRLGLVKVFVEAKEPAKARAALEALMQIDPEYPGAKELLEELPQ